MHSSYLFAILRQIKIIVFVTLEGGGSLDVFIMSQKIMDAKNILISTFQRLKFFSLNLFMILTFLLSINDIIHMDTFKKILFGIQSIQSKLKHNNLPLEHAFVPQYSKNMPIHLN